MSGLGSALLAGVLFLASPRKSSQKEGDPRLRGWLRQLPCATRRSGRLAKLACGSDNASRRPPALLGCSALHMGTRKAGWLKQRRNYSAAAVDREKRQKMKVARCDASHLSPSPSLPRRRESRQCMDSRLRGNDGAITQRAALIQQPKRIGQPTPSHQQVITAQLFDHGRLTGPLERC